MLRIGKFKGNWREKMDKFLNNSDYFELSILAYQFGSALTYFTPPPS